MSNEEEEETIVNNLASYMKWKLRNNAHKEHWRQTPIQVLLRRLREETNELEKALEHGNFVQEECADVANFAAMILDNYELRL